MRQNLPLRLLILRNKISCFVRWLLATGASPAKTFV
ncbi:hypothetical protein V172_20140 [Citrobacter freundii RLS1]|jgi:hypothetical protein|nr:hypothetical protein V172_20140 [Citrobacter freundii RLS1]